MSKLKNKQKVKGVKKPDKELMRSILHELITLRLSLSLSTNPISIPTLLKLVPYKPTDKQIYLVIKNFTKEQYEEFKDPKGCILTPELQTKELIATTSRNSNVWEEFMYNTPYAVVLKVDMEQIYSIRWVVDSLLPYLKEEMPEIYENDTCLRLKIDCKKIIHMKVVRGQVKRGVCVASYATDKQGLEAWAHSPYNPATRGSIW